MFLKVQDIDGESEDSDHEEWIDILSWSWGMSQAANTHMGGGGGMAQSSTQDLSVIKFCDRSTPALMHTCLTGNHIGKAELQCTKATGDDKGGALAYIVLVMEDIVVSSVGTGGSGAEDRMTESCTLNFAKCEYMYTVQGEDGAEGEQPTLEWDIKKGEGSIS